MAIELAKAYVQVIPSFDGVGKAINKEFGKISGTNLGQKLGADYSKGIGSKLTGAGSKIAKATGKVMKTGLVTSAAVTGGLMAAALSKGFGRLKSIEQAEVSMRGLGMTAGEISSAMDSAMNSVTGTAFGFGEAAAAASGFATAGVELGDSMDQALTGVADTATQAGVSFSDMGNIWQKVAAKQKFTGEEAAQLMERNINGYQAVANMLGITTEEAMKLGQQGKISFQMFADAMEQSFGGSAQLAGETVQGSIDNTGAALSRLGEKVLYGPYRDLPAIFKGITNEINAITPQIAKASDTIYSTLKGTISVLSGSAGSVDLNKVFGKIDGTKISATLINVREDFLNLKTEALQLKSAFIEAFAVRVPRLNLDQVLYGVERLSNFGRKAAEGVMDIAAALAPFAANATQAASVLGAGLFESLDRLLPAALELGEALATVSSAFSELLVPAAEITVAIITPLAGVIADVLEAVSDLPGPVLAAGAAFISMRTGLGPLPKLVELASGAIGKIGPVLTTASKGMTGIALAAQLNVGALGKVKGTFATVKGVASGMGGALRSGAAGLLGLGSAAGPVGLGVAAVTAGVAALAIQSANTKSKIADLAKTFDETGQATQQTRDAIYNNLLADENWFGLGDNLVDRFKDAGFEINDVIDAVAGNKTKLTAITDELERMAQEMENSGNPRRASELRDMSHALKEQAGHTEEAAQVSKEYQDAMKNASDKVKEHEDAVRRQIDAQREANGLFASAANATLSAREAQRSYNDAVTNANKVLQDEEATQSERERALDRVAQSTLDLIEKQNKANASQTTLNETMRTGRQDFIDIATQMGHSKEEAETLADSLGLIEGTYTANIEADAMGAYAVVDGLALDIDETTGIISIDGEPMLAETKLAGFMGEVDETTGEVTIDGHTFPAEATVADLMAHIALQAGEVEIDGNTHQADVALAAILEAIRTGNESVNIDGKTYDVEEALAIVKADIQQTQTMPVTANTSVANKNIDSTKSSAKAGADMNIGADTYKASRSIENTKGSARRGATMPFYGNASAANNTVAGVKNYAGRGATMPIYGADHATNAAWRIAQGISGMKAWIQVGTVGRGMRGLTMADGGVVKYFADGGFENHVAQIAPAGSYRVWAEKETGGEAYIPLAASKRDRSTKILSEVAQMFGYQLIRKGRNYANGAVEGPSTGRQGGNVYIENVYNPINEPLTTTSNNNLQRVASLTGGLI